MVHKRAGPGMVVQQEVMVESKEKCKREEKTLRATIEKGMSDSEDITFKYESEQKPGQIPGDGALTRATHTRDTPPPARALLPHHPRPSRRPRTILPRPAPGAASPTFPSQPQPLPPGPRRPRATPAFPRLVSTASAPPPAACAPPVPRRRPAPRLVPEGRSS